MEWVLRTGGSPTASLLRRSNRAESLSGAEIVASTGSKGERDDCRTNFSLLV
jgi:hypothetical protein